MKIQWNSHALGVWMNRTHSDVFETRHRHSLFRNIYEHR
jgi:hypothetical protein